MGDAALADYGLLAINTNGHATAMHREQHGMLSWMVTGLHAICH